MKVNLGPRKHRRSKSGSLEMGEARNGTLVHCVQLHRLWTAQEAAYRGGQVGTEIQPLFLTTLLP